MTKPTKFEPIVYATESIEVCHNSKEEPVIRWYEDLDEEPKEILLSEFSKKIDELPDGDIRDLLIGAWNWMPAKLKELDKS